MTAYERVQSARANSRRTTSDFIKEIFTQFIEMHGDRRYGDDRAIIAGIGLLGSQPVTVIGIEKGHGAEERHTCNSGSVHPEGYRKALRQMKLAQKFGRPIICFVDTPGACCGIGAEERGQGQAIAENLMEMIGLNVPIISIVIGEGGSGGALALAVADEVWMLENAVYSVIAPEGCASILWKDASLASEASNFLKLTAEDLLSLGIIEKIITEEENFCNALKEHLKKAIKHYIQQPATQLVSSRYDRYRKMGVS
ncbi:MAG: acetyl-CoA carboxylase carboxyl transferase subunit alpha [Defluviitaleaceae bacterium]|nr:acetyl-CoA carboxylase carboxyl transferase subunit alpha [Defluviitaleaceae bacterium]